MPLIWTKIIRKVGFEGRNVKFHYPLLVKAKKKNISHPAAGKSGYFENGLFRLVFSPLRTVSWPNSKEKQNVRMNEEKRKSIAYY